ncbi:MAG: hypothetical protein ACR2KZ_14670 [Segetibacter sp.]
MWQVADHPFMLVRSKKGWIVAEQLQHPYFTPSQAVADWLVLSGLCEAPWVYVHFASRRMALDALEMALLSHSPEWNKA